MDPRMSKSVRLLFYLYAVKAVLRSEYLFISDQLKIGRDDALDGLSCLLTNYFALEDSVNS